MILYVAIAGLLAMMGGFVYYASLDNPHLELVEVKLQSVKVMEVNQIEERAKLEVTFLVKNPSDKTVTVPLITYDLYANDQRVGSSQYSTQDVAMPGRAAFYPGTEIPLKNVFQLTQSELNSDIYQAIIDERPLTYSAEGIITVESAWSIVEKEFKTSM